MIKEQVDREISATTRWGIGIIIAMLVQTAGIVYWAAAQAAQISQNERDIAVLRSEVNDIEVDIRSILIGIEQVKARLGIVESTDTR